MKKKKKPNYEKLGLGWMLTAIFFGSTFDDSIVGVMSFMLFMFGSLIFALNDKPN